MEATLRNEFSFITDTERKVKEALEIWSKWMEIDDTDLSYPSKSTGFLSGGGAWGTYCEDQAHEQDNNLALGVDAILNPDSKLLTTSQRVAVQHFHIAAVWTSKRTNIEDDYAEAIMIIGINLRKRNLI